MNAVLIRQLAYAEPQRLAIIRGDLRARSVSDGPFSEPDFDDLRREGNLFEEIAAVVTGRVVIPSEDAAAEMIRRGNIATNSFRLVGAQLHADHRIRVRDSTRRIRFGKTHQIFPQIPR